MADQHHHNRNAPTIGPTRFQPINAATAAAVAHKLPDVNAIVNSCDEMLKIAAHTREKAKLLQRQITELGRASLARARRVGGTGGTGVAALNQCDSELHQIRVTAAPKTMVNTSSAASSASSTSLSSVETAARPQSVQSQQPKLKTIATIVAPHSARPTVTPKSRGAALQQQQQQQQQHTKQTQSGLAQAQSQRRANADTIKPNVRRNVIATPKRSQQLQTQGSNKGAPNAKTTAMPASGLGSTSHTSAKGRLQQQQNANAGGTVVMLSPTAPSQRAHTAKIDQSHMPRVTSAKQQPQQQQQQIMQPSNNSVAIGSSTGNSPLSQSPKMTRPAR